MKLKCWLDDEMKSQRIVDKVSFLFELIHPEGDMSVWTKFHDNTSNNYK